MKSAGMVRINGRDFEPPVIKGLKAVSFVGIPEGSLDSLK